MESFVNLAGGDLRVCDGDDRAAPGRRRPSLRPPQGRVLLQRLRGSADRRRGGGHHLAAVQRLLTPQPLEQSGWGLALSVVSSALNGVLAWRMLAQSREHRSIALEADARHLFTDVWTSAGVVVGLLVVPVTGWLWLDPVMAIGSR